MNKLSKIKELYESIPKVNCIEGCSNCCGIVPWSRAELNQLRQKLPQRSITCPYLKNDRCTVYNQRPFMCRLFGTVPGPHPMACPKGAQPIKPLDPDEAQRLTKRYQSIVGDKWITDLNQYIELLNKLYEDLYEN